MILGQVIRPGDEIKQEFPCVKRWQSYNTYALFSSETQAVIISADTAHDNDFVGNKLKIAMTTIGFLLTTLKS